MYLPEGHFEKVISGIETEGEKCPEGEINETFPDFGV